MRCSYKIGFTCAYGKYIYKLVKLLSIRKTSNYIYGFDATMNKSIKKNQYFKKVLKLPLPNEGDYINSLVNHLGKNKKSVIIFGSDEEADIASKNIRALDKTGSIFNLMNNETIKIFSNKNKIYTAIEHLNENKIIKPFRVIENKLELKYFIKELNGSKDVILKPLIGRGSREVYIINVKNKRIEADDRNIKIIKNSDISSKIFEKNNKMLAMEYIEGKSITIDVLANNGEIIQIVPRLWLNGKKNKKIIQSLIDNNQITNLVNIINSVRNIHGLIDIDAKIDENGDVFLLEVNPRPSGSIYATELMGIPIFSMLIDILLGKKIISTKIKKTLEVTL